MNRWTISDQSPTRVLDEKTRALVADLTGLMDAEQNARTIADDHNRLYAAERAAEKRGLLLVTFVYHVRRGNLLPYTTTTSFPEQLDGLCQRAEEHFETPVHPLRPMPAPKRP